PISPLLAIQKLLPQLSSPEVRASSRDCRRGHAPRMHVPNVLGIRDDSTAKNRQDEKRCFRALLRMLPDKVPRTQASLRREVPNTASKLTPRQNPRGDPQRPKKNPQSAWPVPEVTKNTVKKPPTAVYETEYS